jgi:branched-chain amino acid transport system substrate-binding protein
MQKDLSPHLDKFGTLPVYHELAEIVESGSFNLARRYPENQRCRRGGEMRAISPCGFVMLVLALVINSVGVGFGAASPDIKIGLNMDYSGAAAFEGQGVYKGALMAFDEQNAAGGVNGHKIIPILADNQCDPSVGINAIRSLIAANVDAIIGSNCSSVTLAQMPIIQTAKIPMLAVEDSNPRITQQAGVGGNSWMFRLNVNDEVLASVFGKRVIAKEVKTLAILAAETDYGKGVVEVIQKNLPGVKVVSVDYFRLGQSDFRSVLTKVKSESPEGVLIVGDYPEGSQIINQLHEIGLTNVKLYARGETVAPDIFKLLGDPHWADGIKEATFWAPGLPASKYLEDKYKAKYNEPLTRVNGMGYFGAKVIMQAISLVSGPVTPASIRNALEKVSFDLPGLGHVKFDDHHQAHYPMVIDGIVDGKIVNIEVVPTS